MPRVSLRRAFLYFSGVASCSLLLVLVNSPPRTVVFTGARRPSSYGDRPVLVIQNDVGSNKLSDKGLDKDRDYNVKEEEDELAQRLIVDRAPTPPLPSNHSKILPHERPWYMKDGKRLPEALTDGSERKLMLWPSESDTDRIEEQLMFKPPPPPPQDVEHPDVGDADKAMDLKKILMYNGMSSWGLKAGRGQFLKLKCPVDTCVLTGSRSEIASADAIVFKDHFSMPQIPRDPNQIWIMYMLECPLHTQHFTHPEVFNWTATYRHDSDIVAPYERWTYHDPLIKQVEQPVNYAQNKTRKVAWFVSNCGARNNRLQYAKELSKYITVDIYGACGSMRCPRSSSDRCFDMLNKDYKFYLAFENSNCRDYITEKFFVNGLRGIHRRDSHHILPIVMGAHPDDYARAAPYRSYIHVDDFSSPKALADYLHLLDQNPDLYNEYFKWKGTGEFINTYFLCRLCTMMHDDKHVQYYQDINKWWRGSGTCISGSWRKRAKIASKNKDLESKDVNRVPSPNSDDVRNNA